MQAFNKIFLFPMYHLLLVENWLRNIPRSGWKDLSRWMECSPTTSSDLELVSLLKDIMLHEFRETEAIDPIARYQFVMSAFHYFEVQKHYMA